MGPGENEHVETVEDIKIPLLKSLVYTTGRGGTVGFPESIGFGYVVDWADLNE